jgi:hypothetical protein
MNSAGKRGREAKKQKVIDFHAKQNRMLKER